VVVAMKATTLFFHASACAGSPTDRQEQQSLSLDFTWSPPRSLFHFLLSDHQPPNQRPTLGARR
jgi:hypothetical protein